MVSDRAKEAVVVEMMVDFSLLSVGRLLLGLSLIASLGALLLVAILAKWGSYWLQAYMSGADVSMKSLKLHLNTWFSEAWRRCLFCLELDWFTGLPGP